MNRGYRLVLAGLAVILGLAATPCRSTDHFGLSSSLLLIPESNMSHPQSKVLALVAKQKMTLVRCSIYYSHQRNRFITSEGERVPVQQPDGGSVEVVLEVLRKKGSAELDRRKIPLDGQSGWVGWVDPSGSTEPERSIKKLEAFPLKLKKNQAVLFTLEFTGMPEALGVERAGGEIQYDDIQIDVGCETCGSNDAPCPEGL